jgi:hypothetical protein
MLGAIFRCQVEAPGHDTEGFTDQGCDADGVLNAGRRDNEGFWHEWSPEMMNNRV